MKRIIFFISIILLVVVGSVVKQTMAQEKVQQVFDIACIVSDIPSWKDCIQKVQDGKNDFIKITAMITCTSQSDCAMRLSDINRTVLIYGASNTDTGFKRTTNFDYALLTIQNSSKVSIGGFVIDDSSEATCPTGQTCVPALLIQNSTKTLIEGLHVSAVKDTGILVQGSTNTTIKNSIFVSPANHGIEVQTPSTNTVIDNNTFQDAASNALVFASLGTNSITNNKLKHNHREALFAGCGALCTGAQIVVAPGTGTLTVSKNSVQDGDIDLYGPLGLTASGIEISGTDVGATTISCNSIFNNTGNGIVVSNRTATGGTLQITNNSILNNGIDLNVPLFPTDQNTGNCYSGGSCVVTGC